MKILEVKNNLVKISYNNDERLVLSGFVIIEDEKTPYVAQIVNLKADDTGNYAIVRLIFTFNSDGIVSNYDGSIPTLDALVTPLPSEELLDILPMNNPLKIGLLAQQGFLLNLDQTILKKDLIICSDKNENTSILVNNIIKQLQRTNQKVIVCDIDDAIEHEDKFVFGEDFKLPLNFDTINFIWENALDDVDATSKAVIQDIFLELQDYAQTAPHKFIPFDQFIEVVNSQYEETNIPELVLLKNKLLKYEENNVFANHHSEFESLDEFLRKNISTVIDLSTAINPKLQKQIIEYVYGVMHDMRETIVAITAVNNANSDKKLLKLFYSSGNVFTTVICSHEYKFIAELKQIARNVIFFTPQTVMHDFASYNTFLNKLNQDEFVVYGELTQNIPLIVQSMQLEAMDTLARKLEEEKRIEEEKQKEFEKAQAELEAASKPIMTTPSSETVQEEQQAEQLDEYPNEENEAVEEEVEEVENNADDKLQTQDALESEDTTESDENIFSDTENFSDEIENNIQDEIQEPVDEIVIQEDGSEIEEEILPPDEDNSQEYITEDIATTPEETEEEITIEEPLPEDPYQNIFDKQTPFENSAQQNEPITDNAARDVDEYIIYNDKKDEIPSIDEVIANEESEHQNFVENSDLNDADSEIPNILQHTENEEDEESNAVIIEELHHNDETEEFSEENTTDIHEQQTDDSPEETQPEQPYYIEEPNEPAHSDNKYVGISDFDNAQPQTEDTLTEDDLNFIDELNFDNIEEAQPSHKDESDGQIISFEEFEQETQNSDNKQDEHDEQNLTYDEPQIVPVYSADDSNDNIDIVEGNTETFEQGDKVSHPKYGIGIVEKMIKYGNKTLCSINFENVGRRLLDPAISEISKA